MEADDAPAEPPEKKRKPIVPYHGTLDDKLLTNKQKRMMKKRQQRDRVITAPAQKDQGKLDHHRITIRQPLNSNTRKARNTKNSSKTCETSDDQGPLNGGVSNGGVSRSGLVLPFLSFLGLSRFFRDFPDLLGDGLGIFPIRPFSLSRPIKSTYEEQSRKGPRHNLDLS